MSRPVSTAHGTALAETLTRPLYLVELGFPVPVRLSSRETTTWNSLLWTAASFRLSMPAGNWTLEVFNEALLLGQTVLTHGTAGRTAKVYHLTGEGPFAADDAEQLLDGEMGQADIGLTVRITLKPRPPQRTPRLYFNPPTFNHLPPDGLIITTGAGTTELTTKKRSLSPYGAKRG